MPKEITIKLPDGTTIKIPSGDTESLKTTLALVTGKEVAGGVEEEKEIKIASIHDLISASKIESVASIIRNHYPEGDWFTSNEVCELYEIIFKEGIKMSTVSTYLSRLADEKLLNRKGNVSQRLYSITKKLLEIYGELKVLEIPPDFLR
jgi:predicted transcriptional regulator